MKILCMYSGGLDSCGALWYLLTDKRYANNTILVHHIHIINHENRFLSEKIAVEKTLAAIKKNISRPFYYSESTMDFQFLPYPSPIPYDTDCYAFVAGNLATIDTDIAFVATGRTQTDVINDGGKIAQMVERRQAVFDALFMHREHQKHCSFIYPVEQLTKEQIWLSLPNDVRENTWSCRRPIYNQQSNSNVIIKSCQVCPSCVEILKFDSQEKSLEVV